MFRNYSLFVKMLIFLILIIVISTTGFSLMLNHLHKNQLRNEARTLSEHVVAFRSWVASYGVVWVKDIKTEYLGKEECPSSATFYSKNPALATRELAHIANSAASHTNFRVTSDNFRNPKNSPDSFETAAITIFKQNKSFKEHYAMEGSHYRYAAPLVVKKGCLKCHSDPSSAPDDVIEKYGTIRGFGYQLGDIRGVISITIPTEGMWLESLKGVALWQVLILSLIVIVAFIFSQVVFAKPLKNLAESVDSISKGREVKLDVDIIPTNTSNEIDKVFLAVGRLQLSMQLALKRLRKKD